MPRGRFMNRHYEVRSVLLARFFNRNYNADSHTNYGVAICADKSLVTRLLIIFDGGIKQITVARTYLHIFPIIRCTQIINACQTLAV